jgi:cytochrome bd-type quinol oxidase subunit 1
MLATGAKYIEVEKEDDADFQRNLSASGHLMAGVGLFIVALFVLLPFLMIRDLSEKQKNMLVLLLIAILIGFTVLASSGPLFSFSF